MKEPTSSYIISHNEVDNSNLKSHFFEIIKKVKAASHIAIDLEFTTLSEKRPKDMNHRYVAMKEAVESGAILSIGLSIVRLIDENKDKIPKIPTLTSSISDLSSLTNDKPKVPSFTSSVSDLTSLSDAEKAEILFTSTAPPSASVDTSTDSPVNAATATTTAATTTTTTADVPKYEFNNFNILTLKQGNFRMDAKTGTFLVEHGYSFDQLFKDGIPLLPPSVVTAADNNNKEKMMLRKLWKIIMEVMHYNKVPMVIHHGIYDLLYIYHSFIGELPDTFRGFLTCISEHFPSGIYDTRYLAEQSNYDALFLKYVFDKSDRMRQNRFDKSTAEKPYFEIEVKSPIFARNLSSPVRVITGVKRNREQEQADNKKKMPLKFNFCQSFSEHGYCSAHDDKDPLHDVQTVLDFQMGPSKYPQVYTSQLNGIEGAHSAHFDAYMTGFSFCYFLHTLTSAVLKSSLNKVALSGLIHPITIPVKQKSIVNNVAQTNNKST